MSDAIGATGEGTKQASSNCRTLKCGHKIPSHPKAPKMSDVHLSQEKEMESSVSNFSGNDNIAELGAEAGWENLATCCKLSSIEITAMELDVGTATVSTKKEVLHRNTPPRKGYHRESQCPAINLPRSRHGVPKAQWSKMML